MRSVISGMLLLTFILVNACKKESQETHHEPVNPGATDTSVKGPTPYELEIPKGFPVMRFAADNPLTVEGIALGKKLFFDKILSVDNTVSCGSCHKQELSFVDEKRVSIGVNGAPGVRNSMPLFNLGWAEMFNPATNRMMWDGAAATLEDQVLLPIANPVELNHGFVAIEKILNSHAEYPALFKAAFGPGPITIKKVSYAIAQFERTLISYRSKYDRSRQKTENLTEQEKRGLVVFSLESKGGCFHCHGSDINPFFTDFRFHNNGLDSMPTDAGLAAITGRATDHGMFKTPSLRNLAFTVPYMHDGRFKTLEEVVEHYNSGVKVGPTTDVNLIQHVKAGGLQLSQQDKEDLIAFLNTLNDYEFLKDERFKE